MSFFLMAGGFGSRLNLIFEGFDWSVFEFFGNMQTEALNWIAKIFTAMGCTPYVVLFAVLGLVLCFFKRSRRLGFSLIFAVLIGFSITNLIIKPLALRVRPYVTYADNPVFMAWYSFAGALTESDYSFPSGHSTSAMELAMALLLCHATGKRKEEKMICWIFPLVALLVGASRIYLMVHYVTDVIAGLIIGAGAGVAGFFLSGLVCKAIEKHRRKPARVSPAWMKWAAPLTVILAWLLIFAVGFWYTLS